MRVGVPAEVRSGESRVALTPAGVHELTRAGHQVLVEAGAGAGSSLPDHDFTAAGAVIAPAADVWAAADLVLKVNEPAPAEYGLLRPGQVLFSFLRLAASLECTEALLRRRVTAIACETVRQADGSLPLLAPMSEVAGRMAPQVGARHLRRAGGAPAGPASGALASGVPGVEPARVVVLGAGTCGLSAAAVALGLQAEVLLLDRSAARLRYAGAVSRGRCQTITASPYAIEQAVVDADLVIGAASVPGARAPQLVSKDLVKRMKPGSVLVDVAVDQGGCFEGARPTTHCDPVFAVHDSLYYCVANLPGAVPHTSTYTLTSVTLPYALALANRGWRTALRSDEALARGLAAHDGALTSIPVAEEHDLEFTPLATVLA